jgi:hypothetical protein
MMQRNRPNRLATEPKAWWQRVAAGERLPKGPLIANSKCEGTVEDPRNIALDVREMIRKRVFEQPVGSVSPSREQCCYAAPDVAHLPSHHRRDFRNRPCRSRRRQGSDVDIQGGLTPPQRREIGCQPRHPLLRAPARRPYRDHRRCRQRQSRECHRPHQRSLAREATSRPSP